MSGSDLDWLKLRFSWLTSERVQFMPSLAELALIRLILRCGKSGSIPACPDKCLALVGKHDMTREAVEAALGEFEPHPENKDRLVHVRTLRDRDETVEKVERIREMRSKAGKKGAAATNSGKTTANERQSSGKAPALADLLPQQSSGTCRTFDAANERHLPNRGEEWSGVEWSGVEWSGVLPKEYNTSLVTPETPPAGGASPATSSAPLDKVQEPPETAKPAADTCPHREIARLWNSIADRHAMPRLVAMTPARETTLRGMWAWFEGGRDEKLHAIRALFERTAASDFLRTGPGRFDWVIQPSNRVKILEGNYDNGRSRR